MIVDDNSPDGTGVKADELATEDSHINVLHRKEKNGLLGAYLAGFDWGKEKEYEVIVQMDADGSHAPEQLHLLLEQIDDGADLVIGSRYVDGGKVVNWPKNRYLLSKGGNLYISMALSGDIKDMTAGYRAIRRELLETIDVHELSTKGYIFQVELAFRAIREDFDVREVPITFTERELGESKLDASFAGESFAEVTKWGAKFRMDQLKSVTSYVKDLAGYELGNSKLAKLPAQAREVVDQATNLASEGIKLAKYELSNSKLSKVPGKVKEGADQVAGMATEGGKLLDHEIKHARN